MKKAILSIEREKKDEKKNLLNILMKCNKMFDIITNCCKDNKEQKVEAGSGFRGRITKLHTTFRT